MGGPAVGQGTVIPGRVLLPREPGISRFPDVQPDICGLVLAHHPGMTTSRNEDSDRARISKCCRNNAIVSGRAGFSPLLRASHGTEMSGSNACAATPFGRTVDFKFRPDF
jgi:hypothetical protein